jgi:hypothetical protein
MSEFMNLHTDDLMVTMMTAWLRLLSLFMDVSATLRLVLPALITCGEKRKRYQCMLQIIVV